MQQDRERQENETNSNELKSIAQRALMSSGSVAVGFGLETTVSSIAGTLSKACLTRPSYGLSARRAREGLVMRCIFKRARQRINV